jgi:hypothetical protein
MAVTAALAPARDVVGSPAASVTIGWIAGETSVRVRPAVAVNSRVPPIETRGSGPGGRKCKSGAGNRRCREFSAVPHDPIPCGNRVGLRTGFNVRTCFLFFALVRFLQITLTTRGAVTPARRSSSSCVVLGSKQRAMVVQIGEQSGPIDGISQRRNPSQSGAERYLFRW